MIGILIRAAVFLATAALGLLAAAWLLPDVGMSASGFTLAVVVFGVAQSVLGVVVAKLTKRFAPALLSGFGLISTLAALWIATLVPGGLEVSGLRTWILAAMVVWVVTSLASLLLPLLIKDGSARSA